MAFGIYVHIPYCLQKCHYCDFVTLDMNHSVTPAQYTSLLINEVQSRSATILEPRQQLTSLYFGGGTPSVLSAEAILSIRQEIANNGFEFTPSTEITIEINPGTVTKSKLDQYLAAGVNRFSVGVQTFHSKHLTRTGRLHSIDDSRELLAMLKAASLNYSFDLLFGLPEQTLDDLSADLRELVSFSPPHVSLYNLTVPKDHAMNKNRASDDVQADMFEVIETALLKAGLIRYEISNFAKPGFESRHNFLYWEDQPYWGIGIGAHSYLPTLGPFGSRFWNPASVKTWSNVGK
jgi:oxygen-independent coproporphyrinogen-3 oxidase